jgi:two-component system CheB/CheR fusion protein
MLPFLTIALGASVGDLQAFTDFLAAMPPNNGMAFLLIQHLDPAHKSLLVGLLSGQTAMPIVEAVDGMPLATDTVFVIPPDATLLVRDGRLVVTTPAPARRDRLPIDRCFTALAQDQGPHAVAIVLAGVSGDGSAGLAAIKQYGGMTMAQAGDDGHALAGMPSNATATRLVDHLLPIGAMPAQLLQHQASLRAVSPLPDDAGPLAMDPEHFAELCALLRTRTGHDFSQYKRPTLLRRINRRMETLHLDTMPTFLDLLRREPGQIERLFRDLLIHVTQFMRDPGAFRAVQEQVIPALLAGKGVADAVRIWVPGCSTGEEPYSLAILLRELMDRQEIAPKVQICATDIDEAAIMTARAGCYPAPTLTRLAPAQRAKWFAEDGKSWRVSRTIRDMCVMSTQIPADEQNEQVLAQYLAVFPTIRYGLGPHTTFESRSRSIPLCQSPRSSRTPISTSHRAGMFTAGQSQERCSLSWVTPYGGRGSTVTKRPPDGRQPPSPGSTTSLSRRSDHLPSARWGLLLLSPRRSGSSRSTS